MQLELWNTTFFKDALSCGIENFKLKIGTSTFKATHEEADTRLVLHAIQCNFNTVVISARDTDVLLLLVAHFQRTQGSHLWMSGTSKKRRYIPIGEVYRPHHCFHSTL